MESVGYLSSYAQLAADNESTCGDEAASYMAAMKPAVCRALKACMEEKPANPIRFLAEHLQKNNKLTSDESFNVAVDEGQIGTTTVTRLKKRSYACPTVSAVENHLPLIGLQAPSADELAATVDAIAPESLGKDPIVHVIVQRDPTQEYVYLDGNVFRSDYRRKRVSAGVKNHLDGTVVAAAETANPAEVKGLRFNLGTPKKKPTEPDEILAEKAGKAAGKKGATVGEVLAQLKPANVAIKISYVDTIATTLPVNIYDHVNSIIGQSDVVPLPAVVVVSFAQDIDAMKVLLTASQRRCTRSRSSSTCARPPRSPACRTRRRRSHHRRRRSTGSRCASGARGATGPARTGRSSAGRTARCPPR